MPRVQRTPAALRDLVGIADWISRDSEEAAFRVLHQIDAAIDRLRTFPNLGQTVDHLRQGIRRTSAGAYAIYYRVLQDGEVIEIDRVVHGARDVDALFP